MKKRKRLLVILSTFVMAAQPLCVAAEMQDAEGFGAVEEIWADEENEEEFSAAPEVGNEDLNGFQAEIFTEENDRKCKGLVRSSGAELCGGLQPVSGQR